MGLTCLKIGASSTLSTSGIYQTHNVSENGRLHSRHHNRLTRQVGDLRVLRWRLVNHWQGTPPAHMLTSGEKRQRELTGVMSSFFGPGPMNEGLTLLGSYSSQSCSASVPGSGSAFKRSCAMTNKGAAPDSTNAFGNVTP
jgi:hypothetical protein